MTSARIRDTGNSPSGRQLIFEKGSGSIASTAGDMGLYVSMLANRGSGRSGVCCRKKISACSSNLTSRPIVRPTASYGYGIAIDQMDGHTIARHTGGMVSFMSSIQVDLDEGGELCLASTRKQGYRRDPVVIYALSTMRAANASQPMPPMPPRNSSVMFEKADEYARTI